MNFEIAIEIVLKFEGGYVNNPNDPGGETKYGISKRAYPEIDIRQLDREGAINIYKNDYWIPLMCDEISSPLRLALFDCGVNQGVLRASKLLQELVKVKIDGKIGPKTMAAVKEKKTDKLLIDFLVGRQMHYISLKNFKFFGKGWTKRIFEIAVNTTSKT